MNINQGGQNCPPYTPSSIIPSIIPPFIPPIIP